MGTVPTGKLERELRKLYLRWLAGVPSHSDNLAAYISEFQAKSTLLISREGGRAAALGALADFPAPKLLELSPYAGNVYDEMQQAAIRASLAAGLNSRDVAQQILKAGMDKSYNRLERLARTETVSAYWKNQWDSVADLPALVMVWSSEESKRTCDYCLSREGLVVEDPNIRDHPNGRCTLIATLRSQVKYIGTLQPDGSVTQDPRWTAKAKPEPTLDDLYEEWQEGVKWRQANRDLKGTPDYVAHELKFQEARQRYFAAEAAEQQAKKGVTGVQATAKAKTTVAKATPSTPVKPPANLTADTVTPWADKNLVNPTAFAADIKNSLTEYAGHAFSNINAALRKGSIGTGATPKHIANIDAAMTKSTIKNPVVTRRTTNLDSFKDGDLESYVGKTVSDDGYMSTSLTDFFDNAFDEDTLAMMAEDGIDVARATSQVFMEVNVPAGAKGVWMEPLSGMQGENELLLDRGSKFKITRVVDQGGGKWRVIADLIQ